MAIYICPIDRYLDTTNSGMCKHIMNIADTKHQEWVDSQGLNYKELVLSGNYTSLATAVEILCKDKKSN